MMEQPLITRSQDVLGGIAVFFGTRVPVQTLIDYLTSGDSIDAFLDDYPTVRRDQVVRFLETAGASLIAQTHENSD